MQGVRVGYIEGRQEDDNKQLKRIIAMKKRLTRKGKETQVHMVRLILRAASLTSQQQLSSSFLPLHFSSSLSPRASNNIDDVKVPPL